MMLASKTEDYQLLGDVLDQCLKELEYSREDLNLDLFASNKQHVLDLHCSKGKKCCYKFYWAPRRVLPGAGALKNNRRLRSSRTKWLTPIALARLGNKEKLSS